MYSLEDYNYDLPEELIAQVPATSRDSSRLLLVERSKKSFSDHHFFDLPRLLDPGDLLVVNNTKVVPSRLFGRKESGGQVELLRPSIARRAMPLAMPSTPLRVLKTRMMSVDCAPI